MTVTAIASVTHGEALGFYLGNNLAPLAAPVPKGVTLVGAAATSSHVSSIDSYDTKSKSTTRNSLSRSIFEEQFLNLALVLYLRYHHCQLSLLD